MRTRLVTVLSALLLLAAGCGGGNSAGGGSAGGGSAGDGGLALEITEPANGASVTPPFTIKVNANVPLGPTGSGKHHIHVWFDDKASEYQVVEADHVEVDSGSLLPGEHVIHASLRNANHSAAGAEAQATVMVTRGGGTPASSPAKANDGGDYGYGY